MKTASLVPVIISLVLILGGTFLKLMHWPGGGILTVLGFGMFSFVIGISALLLKTDKGYSSGFKTILKSAVASFSVLSVGVLFLVQHWPFGGMMFLIGLVGTGILLPVIVWKHFSAGTDKLRTDVIIVGLVCLLVVLLALAGSRRNAESYLHEIKGWDEVCSEYSDCRSFVPEWDTLIKASQTDSVANVGDSLPSSKQLLLKTSDELDAYISNLTKELILRCVPEFSGMEDTIHPSRFGRELVMTDISSMYLVGEDPNAPQGEAVNLKKRLTEFTKMYLTHTNDQKLFGDQFTDKEVNGIMESWEVREFYVVSFGKTLVKLKRLQLLVCQAKINGLNK